MISFARNKILKSPPIPTELVCLSVRPKEFSLVYAGVTARKLDIKICESYPYENFKAEIGSVVRKNNLKQKSCVLVLNPSEYELVLTDAMPVANQEFQTAAKWKLKDSVHIPKEDVLFDQFPVPKSPLEPTYKIMVAATRFSLVQNRSNEINEAGLEMYSVDIPEMCYRNLTAFYENDDKSTILVVIRESQVQILITCRKQLFFNRYINIELGPKHNTNPEEYAKRIDRLELEILRSSDYFQNQWRMPSPARYFILPTALITSEQITYISQRLGSVVKFLNVLEIIHFDKQLDLAQQQKYNNLFGEALRLERVS